MTEVFCKILAFKSMDRVINSIKEFPFTVLVWNSTYKIEIKNLKYTKPTIDKNIFLVTWS